MPSPIEQTRRLFRDHGHTSDREAARGRRSSRARSTGCKAAANWKGLPGASIGSQVFRRSAIPIWQPWRSWCRRESFA